MPGGGSPLAHIENELVPRRRRTTIEAVPSFGWAKAHSSWMGAGKINAHRRPDDSYVFDEAEIAAWLQSRKSPSDRLQPPRQRLKKVRKVTGTPLHGTNIAGLERGLIQLMWGFIFPQKQYNLRCSCLPLKRQSANPAIVPGGSDP
jgi:hypothetical protein